MLVNQAPFVHEIARAWRSILPRTLSAGASTVTRCWLRPEAVATRASKTESSSFWRQQSAQSTTDRYEGSGSHAASPALCPFCVCLAKTLGLARQGRSVPHQKTETGHRSTSVDISCAASCQHHKLDSWEDSGTRRTTNPRFAHAACKQGPSPGCASEPRLHAESVNRGWIPCSSILPFETNPTIHG